MNDTPHIWERRPDETEKAYNAFQYLLNMPQPRVFSRLWKEYPGNEKMVYVWKKRYNWDERIRQYDIYRQNMLMADQFDLAKSVQQQVVKHGLTDFAKLRDVWDTVLQRLIDNVNDMPPDDFVKALERLSKMRTQIEILGRTATHLPSRYSPERVAVENDDEMLEQAVIQITLEGPKYLRNGKPDDPTD